MMMTELTAPAAPVVGVEEFAEHLRLGRGFADDAALDAALAGYVAAAERAIEARIGKALIVRRMAFVTGAWGGVERQALPVAPVREIEGAVLRDRAGAVVADVTVQMGLARDAHRPCVVAAGGLLPGIPAGGEAEIVFEAGYGATGAEVPRDLRQAVLLLAADFYERRSASEAAGFPMAVEALIAAHRLVRL